MEYRGIIPINRPDLHSGDLERYYQYTISSIPDTLAINDMQNKFRELIGDGYYALFTPSAKVGLYLLLNTIKPPLIKTTPLICFNALAPIIASGARPYYIDIDDKTFNMDPEKLLSSVRYANEVIMLTYLGGQPYDIEPILQYARDRKIPVIEDVAQALGARLGDQYLGTLGDHAIFSFSKHLALVGGGMVITRDMDLYEKMWKQQNEWELLDEEVIKYRFNRDMSEYRLGTEADDDNYRMNYVSGRAPYKELDPETLFSEQGVLKRPLGIQAAVINNQLDRLENMVTRRQQNANRLKDKISRIEGIQMQEYIGTPAYGKFYITTTKSARETIEKLNNMNIDAKHITKSHGIYIQERIDKSEYYYDESIHACRNYMDVHERIIELPLSSNMRDHEVITISEALQKVTS